MTIDKLITHTKQVYELLEDDLSRNIFNDRLLYSLTGDKQNIFRMILYTPGIKVIVEALNQLDKSIPKYIYGAGSRSRRLKQIWPYDWKGFIDKNEDLIGTRVEELPVVSIEKIKRLGKKVAVIVPNKFFVQEILENLYDCGIEKEYIFNVSEVWNELISRQYFDLPEMPHSNNEIFIDVGAFDGFSSIQFNKWSTNYFKKIYVWEPEQKNLLMCMNNLKQVIPEEKCVFVNKASWDKKGMVAFQENGIGSKINENGKNKVECSTIEFELKNSDVPTFIKMDIEGGEKLSLCGCKDLIKRYTPKLAISIYHKSEDIIELPQLIYEFDKNYKFYLRHYSCTDWDTVLYALPR